MWPFIILYTYLSLSHSIFLDLYSKLAESTSSRGVLYRASLASLEDRKNRNTVQICGVQFEYE